MVEAVTGTISSGDVEIFYRRFGAASVAPPVLILHGAGYYDSADWVDVASRLAAGGREVVAYDARGYGHSSWSPAADYGIGAQLSDIATLLDHLGWDRPVLLGHSRGGSFALRFTAEFPARLGAVIFADACPGRTARGPAPIGASAAAVEAEPVYPTLDAALASTSREPGSLADPAKRARLEQIFRPSDGGYRLALRDPRFQQGGSGGPFDGWAALADLGARRVPTLIIRALRSRSFDDAAAARARDAVPHARHVEIDAGHDLANEAPGELVGAVTRFLSG